MPSTIDLEQASRPSLEGRRVVIVGGTGGVGEGIVRGWLATQADVVVLSRTQGRADELAARLTQEDAARLHFVVGDYTSFAGAEQQASAVEATYGPVTDVVASIGGWWQAKPLWEITEKEWQDVFVGLSTAHVAQVRAWIPRLPQNGSYQLILGGSATTPVPAASLMNMEQAALLMMRQVLSAEVGEQRRVFSTVLGPVETRQRSWVDPSWVSALELGLLSTGLAASTLQGGDIELRTKDQMLAALQALEVYPQETAK